MLKQAAILLGLAAAASAAVRLPIYKRPLTMERLISGSLQVRALAPHRARRRRRACVRTTTRSFVPSRGRRRARGLRPPGAPMNSRALSLLSPSSVPQRKAAAENLASGGQARVRSHRRRTRASTRRSPARPARPRVVLRRAPRAGVEPRVFLFGPRLCRGLRRW